MEIEEQSEHNKLNDEWCLWAHLPHDVDWSLSSYKLLYTFDSVEQTVALANNLSEKCIKNCMLFIMRKNINPIWEDTNNINGGCFSFKISNKQVKNTWNNLMYGLVGETIFINNIDNSIVNGITVSPKKNFCIIKIWINTCSYKDEKNLNTKLDIDLDTCMFKKHISN